MIPLRNFKPRSKSKGPFARVPAWIFRDNGGINCFKALKPSEFKVLGYLASRLHNITDETPAFTISSLTRATKLSRDTVREALKVLENLKIIFRLQTKRGQTAARVMFSQSNYDTTTATEAQQRLPKVHDICGQSSQPTAADYTPTLKARLSVLVDEVPGKSPATGEKVVTKVPKSSPIDAASEGAEKVVTSLTGNYSVEEPPEWVTAPEASPLLGIAGGGFVGFACDDPSFLKSIPSLKGAKA